MPLNPKLIINGVDVTDLIAGKIAWQSGINEPSGLSTSLRLDGERLSKLDLRGRIVLEVTDGDKTHRQFTGHIVEARGEQAQYTLQCLDASQILQENRMGGAFGRGIFPGATIYYLIAEAMPESTDKSLIALGRDGRKTSECNWLFQRRRFMFVAPCPPCTLNSPKIEFGDVTLYTKGGEGNIDDQIIAASLPQDVPSEWDDGRTRVMFYIHAEGFLDAFEKGRKRLRRFMDFLSFAAHLATPSYRYREGFRFHSFQRERALVDFSYPRWLYVRDIVPSKDPRYWLRWYAPHRLAEQFAITADDPIEQLYPAFATLLENEEESLSTKQRAYINAMHALRNARQAESTLDGIDFVWQCVEFLSAGYSIPETFTESDRKALKRVSKCLVEKRHNDDPQPERQERGKRIERRLGQLNLPDLKDKWEAFCGQHGLTYSKEDDDFLWATRKVRNNVLHGRPASITRYDVERAAIILEKALLMAIAMNS